MENISQASLLEVAIYLMNQKHTKQNIRKLIDEVLQMKGLDDENKVYATQLYVDITTSSMFVYMGNEEWDLKDRQPLTEWDKDGSAFYTKNEEEDDEEEVFFDDEEFVDEDDEDSEDNDDDYDDEDDYDDDEDFSDDGDIDRETDDDGNPVESYNDDDFDEDKYNNYMDDYEDIYEN